MPTYISFEINNTTHYISFTEDFTELRQIPNNTTATLSPTIVNNIEFNVVGPVVRCLATHVNPDTGERDCEVMSILTKEFSQERPVMGVLAVPVQEGTVSIGDRIDIV